MRPRKHKKGDLIFIRSTKHAAEQFCYIYFIVEDIEKRKNRYVTFCPQEEIDGKIQSINETTFDLLPDETKETYSL